MTAIALIGRYIKETHFQFVICEKTRLNLLFNHIRCFFGFRMFENFRNVLFDYEVWKF